MDPVTAIGLAVNIISIIDYATKLVSAGRELAKSTDGYLTEHREATDIASDIQTLSDSLTNSEATWLAHRTSNALDENEEALREVADGCNVLAKQLIESLQKLRPQGRGLHVVKASLQVLWKREELEGYRTRLQSYRDQMNSRVLVSVREHLKTIDLKQDARFAALDAATQHLIDALMSQRDVFSDKLDLHTDLLDGILTRQDTTHSLLIDIKRSVSPVPGYLPPGFQPGSNQDLPLHEAAVRGELRLLRQLLASPAIDVNAIDLEGRTALHKAKNAAIAERLIDAMAKINAEDFDGRTPLHMAVINRRLDVVNLLLSRRANQNIQDEEGKMALDYAWNCPTATFMLRHGHGPTAIAKDQLNNTGLFHMAWLGDVEGTDFYLGQGAEVDATNKNGETALLESCRHGDLDIVRLLLAHGANTEVVLTKEENLTPLLMAVKTARLDCVNELLKHRANVEAKDTHGNNALMIAAWWGHWEVAKALLINGNSRISSMEGKRNILHHAIHRNAGPEVVAFLLSRGAIVNVNQKNNQGYTPVLDASFWDHQGPVLELLLKAGGDPNVSNDRGNSPISMAAMKNKPDRVEMLIKYGAHVSRPVDASKGMPFSWTPLHEACWNYRVEVVCILFRHDANTEIADDEGRTPLHHAVWHGHAKAEVVRMLIDNGANVEARIARGSTPLALACQYSNDEVVQVLLDAGANLDATSVAGKQWEAGHFMAARAVLGNKTSILENLIQKGASINTRTAETKRTPLHQAIEEERIDCFKVLMQSSANIDARDKWETTPLMRAVRVKSIETVRTSVQAGADCTLRDSLGRTAWILAKHSGLDSNRTPVDELMRAELSPEHHAK